ncbi:MAG: hypothetical protein R3F31_25865 [Verrucomicrobiales bacterium]
MLAAVGYDAPQVLNQQLAAAPNAQQFGAAAAGGWQDTPPAKSRDYELQLPPELKNRGLIAKVLIWYVKRQIKSHVATGEGVIFGLWDGAKGDVEGVADLLSLKPLRDFIGFVKDPYHAAGEIYKVYKFLKERGWDGVKGAVQSMIDEFMGAQKERLELVFAEECEDPQFVAAYLGGYAVGFIGEQVVVGIVTAGAMKIGMVAKCLEQGGVAATKMLTAATNLAGQSLSRRSQDVEGVLWRLRPHCEKRQRNTLISTNSLHVPRHRRVPARRHAHCHGERQYPAH